jgi:hypothetical protein
MKTMSNFLKVAAAVFTLAVFTGCESTGDGNVSGSVYYGVGFYDPWYYGDYHDHGDIIVTPPSDRPGSGARPEQPIARPSPAPRPTPSIPSSPRPMSRGGGGGGGGRR